MERKTASTVPSSRAIRMEHRMFSALLMSTAIMRTTSISRKCLVLRESFSSMLWQIQARRRKQRSYRQRSHTTTDQNGDTLHHLLRMLMANHTNAAARRVTHSVLCTLITTLIERTRETHSLPALQWVSSLDSETSVPALVTSRRLTRS